MEHLLNYTSDLKPSGHLEVIKIFPDGTEEVHFSDSNVICSGLGLTLLQAFSNSGTGDISPYQITYFQLGVSGTSGLQVSSNGALGSPIASGDYGAPLSFEIDNHDLLNEGSTTAQCFGIIPWAYIKKVSATRVQYQIFADENTCNSLDLTEIGLFSKNPLQTADEGSTLCAYRYFPALSKTSAFSLLFRWTIEF